MEAEEQGLKVVIYKISSEYYNNTLLMGTRRKHTTTQMIYPNVTSLYFVTPLAFNASDGRVPPGTYPKNCVRRSKGGYGTKWRRNIAESFNPLSKVHEHYR